MHLSSYISAVTNIINIYLTSVKSNLNTIPTPAKFKSSPYRANTEAEFSLNGLKIVHQAAALHLKRVLPLSCIIFWSPQAPGNFGSWEYSYDYLHNTNNCLYIGGHS